MLNPKAYPLVIPVAAEHIVFNSREGRGWDSVLSPWGLPPSLQTLCIPGVPSARGVQRSGAVRQKREAGCAFLLEQLAEGHSTSLWQGNQPSSAAMRPKWAALPWFVLEPPCGRPLLSCISKISHDVSLFPCLQALK